jgi:cytidyltransferase-like protein
MTSGRKVALLAAVFDCFHRGHENLLKRMREYGDWVVVILHNDASIYKIKGKIPIQTLEHRIQNLELTGLADEIRTTHSTDPAYEFEDVICDYGAENITYVRGDDLEDFPGKWMLVKHKIPIQFVEYTKGVSSSDIREELLK